MSKPFIEYISSNVGGGVNYHLSRFTLLFGASATGKTMGVRAVQLAALGGAMDIEGRPWVGDDARLFHLVGEGEGIHSKATWSDGHVSTFNKQPGKRGDHAPGRTALSAFDNARDELSASPERAYTYLSRRAAAGIKQADIVERLPDLLKPDYEKLSGVASSFDRPIDLLIRVRDASKKKAASDKKAAKGADAVMASAGAGGAAPPTATQLEEAEAALTAARAVHSQALAAKSHATLHTELKALETDTIPKATATWKQAQAYVAQLREQTAGADVNRAAKLNLLSAVGTLQRNMIEKGNPRCAICGSTHEPPVFLQRLDTIDTVVAGEQAKLAGLTELESAIQRDVQWQNHVQGLVKRAADITSVLPENLEPVDTDRAAVALNTAQNARDALHTARSVWDRLKTARETAATMTESAARYDNLHKTCSKLLAEMTEVSIVALVTTAQKYMPKDWKLRVDVRPSFRFGIEVGGQLYSTMSGAQWASTLSALSIALGVLTEADLILVVPEERAFDGKTLRAMMAGLVKAPDNVQVLLTSTTKPSGRISSKWKVIDVTAKPEELPPEPGEGESVAEVAPVVTPPEDAQLEMAATAPVVALAPVQAASPTIVQEDRIESHDNPPLIRRRDVPDPSNSTLGDLDAFLDGL